MNIEAYIASGILELYVAGLLTEEEVQEVQQMADSHPEVLTEIRQIEEALESYADVTSGKVPSTDMLKSVMRKIEAEEAGIVVDNGNSITRQADLSQEPFVKETTPPKAFKATSKETDKAPSSTYEKKYTPDPIPQKSFLSRNLFGIAASILLIASMALNFFLYQKQENLNKVVSTLMREYHELKSEDRKKDVRLAIYEGDSYKRAMLAGTRRAESASATVYWDAESNDVYIKIHSIPPPGEGLQYQLWALQDGNPVNAGLLTVNTDLQKVSPISGETQAFAITLEPLGGRPSPTLEQMYMQGSVGS